jgi:hypothetical protein
LGGTITMNVMDTLPDGTPATATGTMNETLIDSFNGTIDGMIMHNGFTGGGSFRYDFYQKMLAFAGSDGYLGSAAKQANGELRDMSTMDFGPAGKVTSSMHMTGGNHIDLSVDMRQTMPSLLPPLPSTFSLHIEQFVVGAGPGLATGTGTIRSSDSAFVATFQVSYQLTGNPTGNFIPIRTFADITASFDSTASVSDITIHFAGISGLAIVPEPSTLLLAAIGIGICSRASIRVGSRSAQCSSPEAGGNGCPG